MGDKSTKWNGLVVKVAFVRLDDQQDFLKWGATKNGLFNDASKL